MWLFSWPKRWKMWNFCLSGHNKNEKNKNFHLMGCQASVSSLRRSHGMTCLKNVSRISLLISLRIWRFPLRFHHSGLLLMLGPATSREDGELGARDWVERNGRDIWWVGGFVRLGLTSVVGTPGAWTWNHTVPVSPPGGFLADYKILIEIHKKMKIGQKIFWKTIIE